MSVGHLVNSREEGREHLLRGKRVPECATIGWAKFVSRFFRSFSLFLVALTSNSRKSLDQKPFFAKKHLGQECGRESGGGGGRLLNSFFFFFN